MNKDLIVAIISLLAGLYLLWCFKRSEIEKESLLDEMYSEDAHLGRVIQSTKYKFNSLRLWSWLYLLAGALLVSDFIKYLAH